MKLDKYDRRHRQSLNSRAGKAEDIMDDVRRRAVVIAAATGYEGNGSFFFDDYGLASVQMESLQQEMADLLTANIKNGDRYSWDISAKKMSAIMEWVSSYASIPDSKMEKWTDALSDSLDSYSTKRAKKLSPRVWDLSEQFRQEIELSVEAAMEEGMSADDLSRAVRKYLKEPERLFRRVRDKSGVLRLSKAAKAYHPGQGVYRSSYKNARRMTVTEINAAYREADHLRWKSLPFVKGVEIRLTDSRHVPDICDDLKGIYPKDFKFTGWHPWCRCYAVPVLPSVEEFGDWDGESRFPDEVTDTPGNFDKWVADNRGRMENAKAMPSFLDDNRKFWEGKKASGKEDGLETVAKAVGVDVGKPMTFEEADMRHPNPHYGEDELYRINCQSCVVAYELRRRGLPVEAYGNVKDSVGDLLSRNTQSAWLDAGGMIPDPIVCKQTVQGRTVDRRGYVRTTYTSADEVWNDFLSQTSAEGRYHLKWSWEKSDKGHIITMETFADGTRRFYDPQTGIEDSSILPWTKGRKNAFDLKKGIRAYRVDNLQPNPLIVKGVVKKSGSTLATPSMTAEQTTWWVKNVTNKTSGGVNGSASKLHEWHKEIRQSSSFPISEERTMINLQTGRIWNKGEARRHLIDHIWSEDELKAAQYAWEHPEELRFVRKSPLGEGKNLDNAKDAANIKKGSSDISSDNIRSM